MINEDRKSESEENRNLIAKIVHAMKALDFYKEFESALWESSRLYFTQVSAEAFLTLNVSKLVNTSAAFVLDICRNPLLKRT